MSTTLYFSLFIVSFSIVKIKIKYFEMISMHFDQSKALKTEILHK